MDFIKKKVPIFFTQYANDHIVIKRLSNVEHMLKPTDDLPVADELRGINKSFKANLIKLGEEYLKKNRNGTTDQMSLFGTYKKRNFYYKNKEDFFKKK